MRKEEPFNAKAQLIKIAKCSKWGNTLVGQRGQCYKIFSHIFWLRQIDC